MDSTKITISAIAHPATPSSSEYTGVLPTLDGDDAERVASDFSMAQSLYPPFPIVQKLMPLFPPMYVASEDDLVIDVEMVDIYLR